MNTSLELPVKPARQYLPDNFEITEWNELKPWLEALRDREITSAADLHRWMLDLSEVSAVLSEEQAWRYIRMTIDTRDEDASGAYNFYISEIAPHLAPFSDAFNKKLMGNEFLPELDQEKYRIYLRDIKSQLEIYREENIPLNTEVRKEARQFGTISGAMTIDWEGETLTMQQAAKYLKVTDRETRKKAWLMIRERRAQDIKALDDLFDKLVGLRHQIALNADFKNHRDYKFVSLGRFDYSVQDCFDFHDSIASEIVPIIRDFQLERKEKLGVDELRPWDLDVDPEGNEMLNPFNGARELIGGTIDSLNRLKPFFGECLAIMDEMGYLDLESKQGKSPGGYNYPLNEIGVPFIFMNATGQQRDLVTMFHEGGHAIHSFLARDLELTAFKSTPSEVAELASMSMELLSMDHWDVFYSNPEELRRAKLEQMRKILGVLPWIATVDKFQHWIYENPEHTAEDRIVAWGEIRKEFSTGVTNYEGYEHHLEHLWQVQLHIFELPFYYIEYGMAQLGAIAIWRNYKQNPSTALEQYVAALKLGYTKSIPEIFKTAGIEFNFSREYVRDLAQFIREELQALKG